MGSESRVRLNRRGFLAALGLATGALAVPELWTPKRTFFLPPRGGWIVPVGGGGPYTYAWQWVSDGSSLCIDSPLAASTTFGGHGTGTAQCTVTDSLGRQQTSKVLVNLSRSTIAMVIDDWRA